MVLGNTKGLFVVIKSQRLTNILIAQLQASLAHPSMHDIM